MLILTTLLAPAALGAAFQEPTPRFAAPVELTSAGAPFTGILYPSPVLRDLDGDGRRELILGDLFGALWHCAPTAGSSTAFGERGRLEANGEPLELNNW
ncbi:hypothetical protein Pla163_15290 [Planctomycetes bacterium Pla163]|uniref:FG-GAP repeat protein n=1 Tax=Rohdeia mirabilis TaxID=2528008 RepID=A0A518CYW1_9BACT|nr:hypothetical protein Pla163_15290 [Planctomycetes bacterium Pla163]